MTTAYITTEKLPQVQTTFVNPGSGAPGTVQTTIVTTGPGAAQPAQTTFVTTGPGKVPQSTAYVEVVEDPSVQFTYTRWGGMHNAHTATIGKWKRAICSQVLEKLVGLTEKEFQCYVI